MIQWLAHAFDTFVLHASRGEGYAWWSGPIIVIAIVWHTLQDALKHNCYEHGCWKISRITGDDGHRRCKVHHRALHPDYGT